MEYQIFLSMIFGLLSSTLAKSVKLTLSQYEDAIQSCQMYGVTYFNSRTKSCETCTPCPENTFVKDPCFGTRDTVCSSFKELNIEGDLKKIAMMLNAADRKTVAPTTTRSHLPGVGDTVPVEVLPDNQWFTLSMALLAMLCLTCMGIITYIGIYFFVCKKKPQEKEIVYRSDPEFLQRYPVSEEPRYVEVLSSRERLLRHPWSNYRMNAHESLTLSGLAPISPLQMPKTNIYVNMLDYTTTDDDYVYIDEE